MEDKETMVLKGDSWGFLLSRGKGERGVFFLRVGEIYVLPWGRKRKRKRGFICVRFLHVGGGGFLEAFTGGGGRRRRWLSWGGRTFHGAINTPEKRSAPFFASKEGGSKISARNGKEKKGGRGIVCISKTWLVAPSKMKKGTKGRGDAIVEK